MESSQPDTTEITQQTAAAVAEAHALTVTSADEYTIAGAFITQRVAPVLQMIDTLLGPAKDDAYKMWKRRCAEIAALKEPLETSKKIVNDKLLTYRREEQARAAAEEARLREEARKQEEERRLAQAADLEKRGKAEEAEAVLERPAVPFVPVVKPDIPKVEGLSARKKPWTWRLVDESKVPREYLQLDRVKINAVVRAMGAEANIPGIEPYQDETMAIGAAR